VHRIPGHTEHPRRYALCLPPAYARSGALTIRMTPAMREGRPGRFWRLTVVTHDRWRMSASYAAPGSSSHACRIRSNERITIKSFAVAHAAALKQPAANFPPARVNRQRLQVGRAEWLPMKPPTADPCLARQGVNWHRLHMDSRMALIWPTSPRLRFVPQPRSSHPAMSDMTLT